MGDFYAISYLYYGALGTLSTVLAGVLLSYLAGEPVGSGGTFRVGGCPTLLPLTLLFPPPCRAHQASTAAPRCALVGHHQADILCVPSWGCGAFRGVSHQGNTPQIPPTTPKTPLPTSAHVLPLRRSAEIFRGGRVLKPPRCCWGWEGRHEAPPSTAGSPSSCCRKATCRDTATAEGGHGGGARALMPTRCVGVASPGGDNK